MFPRCVARLVFTLVLAAAAGSAAAVPFDYFANSWAVIGLKDYRDGTRITPTNELVLAGKRRVQLRFGRWLRPLDRTQVKTLRDGWLPVVLVSAVDGPVRYDFTLWATPLPTVTDWRKAFDWPTETEDFLNWIQVTVTNTGKTRAEAKVQAAVTGAEKPDFTHTWSLRPGQRVSTALSVPFQPSRGVKRESTDNAALWLHRTVRYWRGRLALAARIEVPSRIVTETLRAAHVCQLIANDHGELHGGEGFYDQFFIRDGGYQIMELEEAGLTDVARKALDSYLKCQRPDGRFESQKGELDGNGQALWVLWQFWKITGDRDWLATVYPAMRRAIAWLKEARRRAPGGSPFAGLLPKAPADGESLWDRNHHIVGYDFWNLRGLLCTADAAKALGKTDEATALRTEAASYRAAIDAAWRRTGLAYFPPSWEGEGTHWGNTETLWPTELFSPNDPRVAALIDDARRHHGGGFVEGTIRWLGRPGAIHPYLSAYTTMASLDRGEDEQVVRDFYWYLLHSTAAHGFPEGVYYKRRFAWSNTLPHVTGAANFALMLRHMLVHERGDELHLLPAAPDWWLGDGRGIRVWRAPTHFGEISFFIRGVAKGVRVTLVPPKRNPPKRIVLHLPASRPLLGNLPGVVVASRPGQSERWDVSVVVKRYRELAPAVKAIPGLVKLPLLHPLAPRKCRFLALASAANTNPFTAPFGAPQPPSSKYLFSGLPVGVQVVAGVPFRILDPARNGGRALVVLHSPRAPQNIDWPRQITLPVNQRAKRAFFLGNVTGWASSDEGAGPWGAVAEYVVDYADGAKQTVPLITHRTADDWAGPPEATDVVVGLRQGQWHLNVLGVKLRAAKVERITFRDLGTEAAPLLAAVTLEK